MSVKIISIANQKGGVGKTTTAINLATALAAVDKKVLIIDMDPQGNATTSVSGTRDRDRGNSYLMMLKEKTFEECLEETKIPNLKVIPSSKNLSGINFELGQDQPIQFLLKDALAGKGDDFDFIIIDCPPAVGVLTVNALIASHTVMLPVQCEYLALEGVADLMHTIRAVKENLNPGLEIEGVLLTMFDGRNKLSTAVEQDVRGFFGTKVYRTVIPRNVRVSEAPSHGIPVLLYDDECQGARAYISLAGEFLGGVK